MKKVWRRWLKNIKKNCNLHNLSNSLCSPILTIYSWYWPRPEVRRKPVQKWRFWALCFGSFYPISLGTSYHSCRTRHFSPLLAPRALNFGKCRRCGALSYHGYYSRVLVRVSELKPISYRGPNYMMIQDLQYLNIFWYWGYWPEPSVVGCSVLVASKGRYYCLALPYPSVS